MGVVESAGCVHRDDDAAAGRPADRARRSHPDRTGDHQSRDQFARRDGRARVHHHQRRTGRARGSLHGPPPRERRARRALGPARGVGHRTGHGRETQEHAFEPFFTTKPVGAGTGLGLSTASGIIKQSDGYIWLYSEPGIGTTVKVYLPESGGDSSPAEAAAALGAASGETILVVEDEPVVRRLARMPLEEMGSSVIEASSGVEALALIRRDGSSIRLVLADVVMPGMDGQELARILQSDRPDLPLLFMSGYQGEDVTDRGLLDPGAAFIQNPFAPHELIRRVQALIDARQGRREENAGTS